MKSMLIAVAATASLTVAGAALAQSGDDVIKSKCSACHAMDTKKMGPAFKDVAKKYKGNASAEADLVAKLKSGKGHPAVKTSDEDTKTLVKWVLSQ